VQDFKHLKGLGEGACVDARCFKSSKAFPREEMYGLTSQMRRAAVSIGANIAEGSCRGGDHDFARFLQMAFGSASELEYECLLASDLQMLQSPDCQRLTEETREVKRMLSALMQKLRAES
jgi:four helix bundle protein